MTAQKKILDLTGSQYLVQKVKSAISDVDSSLSTHIADTDIHVTTADKATWNTVTSKANDSDVVHKSGNETVSGVKSFIDYFLGKDLSGQTVDLNDCVDAYGGAIHYYYAVSNYTNISNKPENKPFILESKTVRYVSSIDYIYYQKVYTGDYNASPSIYTRYYRSGSASWSNWVKDTDKFVTTDTNQTISGDKVFNNRLIKNIDVVLGTAPSTGKYSRIEIADNNTDSLFQILSGVYDTGNSYARFFVQNKTADDGTGLSPTGTLRACGFNINFPATSTSEGQGSITPRANQTTDLGLSSYQWRNVWCKQLYLNGTQLDPSAFALDANVVHTSGNETVNGQKIFTNSIILQNSDTSGLSRDFFSKSQVAVLGDAVSGDNTKYRFVDKNDKEICYIRQRKLTNSNTDMSFCVNNIDNDNNSISAEINFVIDRNNDPRISPTVTDSISLGRPTFRWKSIYSNSYYYGNVEFSTKFVTTDTDQTISGNKMWSGSNTFKQNITYERTNFYHQSASPCYMLKDTELEKGSLATTHASYPGLWQDKNGNILGYVRFVEYDSGRQTAEFKVSNLIKNGALDPTGSEVNCAVNLELQPSGEKSLIPERNNDINLGTSTNKWKTFNGVEPSSLGMPVAPSSTSYVDISSYITVLDNSASNKFTPPSNGYITFHVKGSQVQFMHDYGLQAKWSVQSGSVNRGFVPVLGGVEIDIYVSATDIYKFWFIPCQGNV